MQQLQNKVATKSIEDPITNICPTLIIPILQGGPYVHTHSHVIML